MNMFFILGNKWKNSMDSFNSSFHCR